MRALIDDAPYSAPKAKEAGLIDGVAYRDELENELKAKLGYKEERSADDREGLGLQSDRTGVAWSERRRKRSPSSMRPATSVRDSRRTARRGRSVDRLRHACRKRSNDAREDKTIKAIVIRVDSPGGSGLASDIIWHCGGSRQREEAGGDFDGRRGCFRWLLHRCGAQQDLAQPSTITGSIGVVAGKPVMRGFYDWLGISNEYILRGKNAGMFRETEKFTR